MQAKCICQICTCGRHRCPHRGSLNKPVKVECTLTEYQHKYEPWPFQTRRESLRPPKSQNPKTVAMDMDTTYASAYVPHKCDKREVLRPNKHNLGPTSVPMDLLSTYDNDFTGETKEGRVESFKPKNGYEPHRGKFNHKTMYQVSYKKYKLEDWDWCRGQPNKHKECIEMNTDKFEATSTQQTDYRKHENWDRRELIKPKQDMPEGGAFNGDTTYAIEYTAKKGEPPPCSIPRQVNLFPHAEFRSETTVRADYQPHPGAKMMPSFKPARTYNPSKGPFETETTSSKAYQKWPVEKMEKPAWSKQKKYNPPTQEFSKKSSYEEEYTPPPKDYKRVQLAKPGNQELSLSNRGDPSKFDHMTHYREQYVELKVKEKQTSFKVIHVYEQPTEQIMAESTYMNDYKGKQTSRSTACRPQASKIESSKMSFETTYGDTFHGEQPKSCPATILAKDKDTKQLKNFSYSGDKHGHNFFVQKDKSSDKNT